MKKDIIYSIACLSFAIIIGGAVYEHLNVVPQWAAAPPVNPEYESRPLTWKLCFRSGKEAVTGARKFAQQWLDEMR